MGIFDSIKDTGQLLKNTFVVIGRNKDIFKPTLAQIWWGIAFYLLLLASVITALFTEGIMEQTFMYFAILFLILMIFLFPFIKTYYKAAQVWLVYKTFTGENAPYSEGKKRANENKGDIFVLTVLDMLFTALQKKLKQGTGKGGFWVIIDIVMKILGKVVEEGWDLLSHYLLPASIIEDKNVGEVLPEIKNIKNNVPGALAGVFGFDFAGDMIRGWIVFIMVLFGILGIVVGIMTGTWIPFIIILLFLIALHIAVKIFMDMLKVIYFTIFYIAVTMPMKIPKEYQDEVTHYLLHKASGGHPENQAAVAATKQSPATTKTAATTKKAAQTTAQPAAAAQTTTKQTAAAQQPQESEEALVNKLIPYIQQYKSQKYTDAQITSFLVKNKWPKDIVQKALERFKGY